MENIELKQESYNITANSKLIARLFTGRKNTIVNKIDGPYKIGTLSSEDKIPINGSIEILPNKSGLLEFTYIAKENFLGDDSFEFNIEFSNGDIAHQIINLKIIEKTTSSSNVIETYEDIYFDDIDQVMFYKTISSKYKDSLDLPTTLTYTSTGRDFKTSTKTVFHDIVNNFNTIINPSTRTKIETLTNVVSVENESNYTKIRTIQEIKFTINKEKTEYANEYGIIKFKDFINKQSGYTIDLQEWHYITWKLRPFDLVIGNNDNTVDVTEFEETPPPEFIFPQVDYPEIPKQFEFGKPIEKKIGDMFGQTKPHSEFDDRGNENIKIGKKVPDDAVNLAYYFNTTASIKDTVSVIETNMNNVSLHYAEDWIHKRNLTEKDENLFPKYIEFEGKVGTNLDGYWGILYREYIMWEEKTIKDLDPKIKTVYQEYRGLKTNDLKNLSIDYKYKDDEREGNLKIINTIAEAINFKNELPDLYTCYTKYEGIVTKSNVKYHGSAKYGGVVTKKDGVANIDPDQPREILMYPDDFGLLHKENGDVLLDDEFFNLTDKFKDGSPLYYKHRLKYRIYDSKGNDKYGKYHNDNIKLILENNYPVDEDKYKYTICVEATKWANIYDAYVYTSFIPTTETPVYVMYDGMPIEAYDGKEKINPINSKIGIIEKLSVYPAISDNEFEVNRKHNITKQSTITMNEINVIKDERSYIPIEYMIVADDMESATFRCKVLNYKYAVSNEKELFINEEMIVSAKSSIGFMTAKDMFIKTATEEQIEKLNNNTVFRIRFNNKDEATFVNKEKVIMYTNPSGGGLVMASTFSDTGFPSEIDTDIMNKKITQEHIYKLHENKFYKGYSVMCKSINQITIHPPVETNPLRSWLPAINYSYFHKEYERIDKTIQLIYSIPEFYNQVYGKYGRPYIDIKSEKPKILGNSTIKTKRSPLYIETHFDWIPKNIEARKVLPSGFKRKLTIKNYNFKDGIIEFEDKISDNDSIEIDYTYEEQFYHYNGYYDKNNPLSKILNINLNPNMYNKYIDNKNEVYFETNIYELFNKTIHFFLKPMRMIDKSTGEIIEDNKFTLYHRIDNQEAIGPFDLHVGKIFIRHHSSLKSTKLIDTRSLGGGILESIDNNLRKELEPESDFYLDIGTLDGKPYHENSVVIIKIDENLLTKNGGSFSEYEIRKAIEKWSAYGMFPIIEYVNVIDDDKLPQNTLEVTTEISNFIKYKPFLETSIVDN